MAAVNSRENTFKVDLSNFPKRPSYDAIHRFVHRTIGLQIHQVKRLQINHALKCAHVKCVDLKTAQDAVNEHNGRHELEVGGVKYRVRLAIDRGCTEVRIHDLSEIVTNEEIANYLRHYGDVHDIKELLWSQEFDLKSVPSGVRVATMTLQTHIKSFVCIRGQPTLVTYKGQPQTCRHCTQLLHPGSTCVQNKKRLKSIVENEGNKTSVQPVIPLDDNMETDDLNRTPSPSFASVLNSAPIPPLQTKPPMPGSQPKSQPQQQQKQPQEEHHQQQAERRKLKPRQPHPLRAQQQQKELQRQLAAYTSRDCDAVFDYSEIEGKQMSDVESIDENDVHLLSTDEFMAWVSGAKKFMKKKKKK